MAAGLPDGLPDPQGAADLADYIGLLDRLRVWGGDPSFRDLAKRVGPLLRPAQQVSKSTIADMFQPGRRRLNLDLVVGVVRALGLDEATVGQWHTACVRVHAQAKTGGSGAVGVFGQLPTDLATFTGRHEELARLVSAATDPGDGDAARTVVISAIEGMAGVGKTQLAVHAAHELVRAGHFADVQLHVNLRGFDPDLPPADPSAVLEAFLRQLAVPAQQIPAGMDERAVMYRDRMRNRQALVLLDNAADEDQVRDLIPAGPTCLVLITSRRSLAGLDGVTPHLLDTFSDAEALELLARITGPDRVAAEPEAAARIVDYCDRLPLAVALTAARLRSRPAWTLAQLADRLQTSRLETLRAGGRAIRPVFDLSYRDLTEPLQRVFRLLGRHPGPDFTPEVVAALANIPVTAAEDALEQLLDENLVRQSKPGRFELHDLLRAYALETAAEDSDAEGPAALERLARWFLCSASNAARAMKAKVLPERADAGDVAPLAFDSHAAALSWLDAEHENLDAVHRAAADAKLYEPTWQLPVVLAHYRNLRFHRVDSIEAHLLGAEAARARDDKTVAAWNLLGAATAMTAMGRYEEQDALITESLQLYQEADDPRGQSWALLELGRLNNTRQRAADAIEPLERSITLNADDRRHVMACQVNIGVTYYELGDVKAAYDHTERALDAARECGDQRAECILLSNLGDLNLELDRADRAHALYAEQQQVAQQVGDRDQYGRGLAGLGTALRAMGRLDEARSSWEAAYAVLAEIGSPRAGQVRELIRAADEDHPADSRTH
ncbi:ATP-binding protein [Streptacidiphilus jiangxiensis]|uniref:Predicted ATPase n=1 Tax=Streptacidiphilus jiangxiensis TaxID=235985 RepID=A0A1H7P0S1_STRJI|nr:tetratricopeptide repeat protein [Streptacidiphilus jiangxiensis]SEL29226.1 Predicted ATPase [Streptacidiphilus jiangxiensis]